MNRLLKWLDVPINAAFWLGLLAGFLMMAHVTIDVAGRALFNRPLDGTTEIVAGYYMVAVAYLPWAWIARNDNHIVAGIFKRIGTPRFEFWLEVSVKILTIAYLSIFVYQTFQQAVRQTRMGEVWLAGTMYIPVWWSRWILPVSGILMLLHLVLRVSRDATRGARLEPETRA
jgi:TRAP-type C4-dicarboxylate transport system permease small subunit